MFIKLLSPLFVLAIFISLGLAEGQARVIVKEKTKYYTISGKDGVQIAQSIQRRGPRANGGMDAIASVQWAFDFTNPEFAIVGNRCKITNVDVQVNLTYVFPKWSGYNRASKELQKRWDRFFKLLKRHEDQHAKIILAGSKRLERSLKRASGRVSKECKDFDASLARHMIPVIQSTHIRNQNLDRREGFKWASVRIAQRKLIAGK